MRFYRTCYDSYYPFQFFPRQKGLSEVEFSDVTILCGSNGSGKSTLLNIIAESLKLNRDSPYNKTDFFDPYIEGCQYELNVHEKGKMRDLMKISRIITVMMSSNISLEFAKGTRI
jgi:predicted ATPase